MRRADVTRATTETQITLSLELDGCRDGDISTGCGFLDHMLELLARHGGLGLTLRCAGDTHVDFHHTVEDVGIALGRALSQALGEMRGVTRYGSAILPMDETLMLCALDLSGRAYLGWEVSIPSPRVGELDTELIKEFMLGLTRSLGCTLHFRQLAGENSHHIIEAMFKALGRALKGAVAIDPLAGGEIPSTKGMLERGTTP